VHACSTCLRTSANVLLRSVHYVRRLSYSACKVAYLK
jgi:hypothetical protein